MAQRLTAALLAALIVLSSSPLPAFAAQKTVAPGPVVAAAHSAPGALAPSAIAAPRPSTVQAVHAAGAAVPGAHASEATAPTAALPQAEGLSAAVAGPDAAASFDRAFDGADPYEKTRELRLVLADGVRTPTGVVRPFGFNVGGRWYPARSAGIEGFLYSKLELETHFGPRATVAQLPDYFRYLDAQLAPYAWTAGLRGRLDALKAAPYRAEEKNEELNRILTAGVKAYQRGLLRNDPSLWLREANIYMIFARAYNRLKPGKDFFDSIDDEELARIKDTTKAEVVWPLDIFEIGEIRRWGTGGGSSYSIKGYKIKPELGGEESFKRLVARAHAHGLKIAVDEIPNHVSLDSDLVKKHPEALLHIVPPQDLSDEEIIKSVPHHRGTPVFYLVKTGNEPVLPELRNKKILLHHPLTDFGGDMWIDMAQRDFSQKITRDWEADEMRRIFKDWGIDMVRRDMAYEVLRDRYFGRWQKILNDESERAQGWAAPAMRKMIKEFEWRWGERSGAEFLEQTTQAIKHANHHAAAIDEVYGMQEETSRTGSSGLYNKIDLYDAWVSRSASRIRESLRNVAFRLFQKGGAAYVNFIGTHDGGEGNPFDKFGRLAKPIALMTLLLRPTLTFNGVEQGVGQALNVSGDLSHSVDRDKAIPMDVPVAINWANADPEMQKFLRLVWSKAEEHKRVMARGASHVLEPRYHETPIQTFLTSGFDESGKRRTLLAAANIGSQGTASVFDFPTRPLLKRFGAFSPDPAKTYEFTDVANPLPDGSPRVYVRSGLDLIQNGLYIQLEGYGVHLFEITERP